MFSKMSFILVMIFIFGYLIQVPSPKDISDDQLQSIVQSGDATHYRVPLSLGEPHVEKDNSK